jgi:hypothetical protein
VFRPAAVDLPAEGKQAAYNAITLPEFVELDAHQDFALGGTPVCVCVHFLWLHVLMTVCCGVRRTKRWLRRLPSRWISRS